MNSVVANTVTKDELSKAEINTSESIKKIIANNGLSVDEFTKLLHPDRILNNNEKEIVDSISNQIGIPPAGTIMSKVIPQIDIYKYLYNPDYKGVRGFTAVKEHGANIKTLNEKYEGVRLDYNNTTFKVSNGVDGISQSIGAPDRYYGTIEYKLDDPEKLSIPNWQPSIDDYPFTGKGFTGSKNIVLPEYVQKPKDFVKGDILKVIDSSTGETIQKFVYDNRLGWMKLK